VTDEFVAVVASCTGKRTAAGAGAGAGAGGGAGAGTARAGTRTEPDWLASEQG